MVLAEPILLTAEERYLHGHYLAYLLSGSRRRGLFLRRPLEPRNADRGRLLLGVTYAIIADATDEAIARRGRAAGPADRGPPDSVADRRGQVPRPAARVRPSESSSARHARPSATRAAMPRRK